jgi:hypothetical protein
MTVFARAACAALTCVIFGGVVIRRQRADQRGSGLGR